MWMLAFTELFDTLDHFARQDVQNKYLQHIQIGVTQEHSVFTRR